MHSASRASCRSNRRDARATSSISVCSSIRSRALEYLYHFPNDATSIGLSFHCRTGSSMRARNRFSCSSCPTSSQILMRLYAAVDDVLLDHRAELEEALVLLGRAEAHDVLDACAIVPAAIEDDDFAASGETFDVALYVHLDFSRSDGAGRATTRKTRGLTRSVIALMVPPFPAASRPSRTMMMRSPFSSPSPADGKALPGVSAVASRSFCGRVSRFRVSSTWMPPALASQRMELSAGDWPAGTVTKRRPPPAGDPGGHLRARHTMR